ncbi:MAG: hypothetical protein EA362_11310 [Saprospirales bacterium]|nr:MAG: hypothetical protein EA362_11310 [Saprospirales bacterium]
MRKFLYEIDRMTRREYRNFILSLGGQISFFKSLARGGTGLGGLYLINDENDWWTYPEDVPTAVAFEKMNKVLMVRMNNTKRNIAYPVPYSQINRIKVKARKNAKSDRMEMIIHFSCENGPDVILENRGWNNKTVINYFSTPELKSFLELDPTVESMLSKEGVRK